MLGDCGDGRGNKEVYSVSLIKRHLPLDLLTVKSKNL